MPSLKLFNMVVGYPSGTLNKVKQFRRNLSCRWKSGDHKYVCAIKAMTVSGPIHEIWRP